MAARWLVTKQVNFYEEITRVPMVFMCRSTAGETGRHCFFAGCIPYFVQLGRDSGTGRYAGKKI